jgi:hypothetical protein
MVIRRIGVGSAARIAGALYAVFGFVAGCMLAAISLVSAGVMNGADSGVPAWIAPMFGVGAIIIAPIGYGILGLIIGSLVALVYNLVAGIAGGLDLEVQ